MKISVHKAWMLSLEEIRGFILASESMFLEVAEHSKLYAWEATGSTLAGTLFELRGLDVYGRLTLQNARTLVWRDHEWLRAQMAAMAGATGDRGA